MYILEEIAHHLATYGLGWILTIATALLGFLYKRVIKLITVTVEQNKAVCEGVKAVLSGDIIEKYNHYKEKEYCPIYAKTNIKNLHKPYKDLGGNSVVDKLVEELLEMPTHEKNANSRS